MEEQHSVSWNTPTVDPAEAVRQQAVQRQRQLEEVADSAKQQTEKMRTALAEASSLIGEILAQQRGLPTLSRLRDFYSYMAPEQKMVTQAAWRFSSLEHVHMEQGQSKGQGSEVVPFTVDIAIEQARARELVQMRAQQVLELIRKAS